MENFHMDDLGSTDLDILRALQADGRLNSVDLASHVNASPSTCLRRTQRLFEEGVITGVRAEIAPKPVGLGAAVVVGVVLDRSTPESFEAFEKAIVNMEEVLDCYLVADDFDYLLKIRFRDMSEFNKLYGKRLIALPGVRQTRTFFVMKEVKNGAPLPF